MPPERADLLGDAAALGDGAKAMGLDLDAQQIETLLGYVALLTKWNRVYNLTAIRDPAEMLVQHLLDSLSAVSPIRRWSANAHRRLLDVGSGAGLPGFVIATAMPAIDVTCVDAVGKKVSFIRQAAAELGVRNLYAIHSRVETLAGPPFDLISSRAFATLADFVALTRPQLAAGGAWLAMKGQCPSDEIAALPAEVEVFHVEPLQVPGLDAARCLVWMRERR